MADPKEIMLQPIETQQPLMSRRNMLRGLGGTGAIGLLYLVKRNLPGSSLVTPSWHGNGDVNTFCDDTAEVVTSYPQEDWSAFTGLASPGFGTDAQEIGPGQSATFSAHVGDTVNPTIDFDTDGDGEFHDAGGSEHWQLWTEDKKLTHPKDCPVPTTTTEAPKPTTTTEAPKPTTTTAAPKPTTTVAAPTTTTEAPKPTTTTAAPTTTTEAPKPTTTLPPAHTD